jgi:hypothetical protein
VKTARFQESYRASSSKLHRKVGDVLRASSIFSGYRIYQEYPVRRLVPAYPHGSHRFDWVVLDLFLIIECHGKQHYQVTNFGGSTDEAVQSFYSQQIRDFKKRQAVEDAGYTYIIVPYTDLEKVDDAYLWQLYIKNRNDSPVLQPEKTTKPDSETHQQFKDRAREYRRAQYQRQKELLRRRRCQDDEDEDH